LVDKEKDESGGGTAAEATGTLNAHFDFRLDGDIRYLALALTGRREDQRITRPKHHPRHARGGLTPTNRLRS
jgi:hypothetical protein